MQTNYSWVVCKYYVAPIYFYNPFGLLSMSRMPGQTTIVENYVGLPGEKVA